MESKEALLKMLDEHGELGLNLKQAWKSENTQETQNFMVSNIKCYPKNQIPDFGLSQIHGDIKWVFLVFLKSLTLLKS